MATQQVKFTITDKNGEEVEVTIDPKLMNAYYSRASEAMRAETNAKAEFKAEVEGIADASGLPKAIVSKYFKARYKDETAKSKELAEVFDVLDEALK